jgi:sarcosine oxidase gamma subunit
VVAALLALPATAAAAQGGQVSSLAAQQCTQLRADIGKKAFRKRFGAKHVMRNCLKRNRARAASALSSAAQDCQLELAEVGPDEFILVYAWDEDTVENAMSECVSATVDDLLAPSDNDESDEEDE